jgi:hypothetical protein
METPMALPPSWDDLDSETRAKSPPIADCHDRALPGEPTFTLLARDANAPAAVREWADRRKRDILGGTKPLSDQAKVEGALAIAEAMEQWRIEHGAWHMVTLTGAAAAAEERRQHRARQLAEQPDYSLPRAAD